MTEQSPFCFPIRVLENSRLKLVPFSSALHSPIFYELTCNHPEIYTHLKNGPYSSVQQFNEEFLQPDIYNDRKAFLFAIIAKSEDGSAYDPDGRLAGMMSYNMANDESFAVEIGHVRTLPGFQGQGVSTAAAALLIKYAMDKLDDGGLGLSRIDWCSDTQNRASIRIAEKLGFTKFGVINYQSILKDGVAKKKAGNGRAKMPPRSGPGDLWRDLVMYTITWDQWEDGVASHIASFL